MKNRGKNCPKPRPSRRSLLSHTHPCNLLSEFHVSMAVKSSNRSADYDPAPHLEDALAPAASRIPQGRLPCLRGPSGNCFTRCFTAPGLLPNTARTFRMQRQHHPTGRVFNLSTAADGPSPRSGPRTMRAEALLCAYPERDLVRFACEMFVRRSAR